MNAPSRADKPSSFLLGIVTVTTRLRRARYGKSRPVHEERRVGALPIMRRSRTAGIAGRTRWRGRMVAGGARAAAGDAGAAGLAGPRLTALGRVSARLKRDWLGRGPDLLPAHLVRCIPPHDRFIDELDLPVAGCV